MAVKPTRAARTRAEKVRRAQELRERGVPHAEIAAVLGVALITVRHYFSDPDGEKARAYRAARHGICEVCGDQTNVPSARRCEAHQRYGSGPPRLWTRDLVVEAIRLWVLTYGEPPVTADWSPSKRDPLDRRARSRRLNQRRVRNRTRGIVPSPTLVYKLFGSWNEAIREAGFTPRPRGGSSGRRRKEACAQGHPFTPENTYLYPDGHRACRICRLEAGRRYRRRHPRLRLGARLDSSLETPG